MVKRLFIGVFLVAAMLQGLTGCSVYSSQVSFLKKVLTDESKKLAEYAWQVEFGEYKATVYAVAAKDGMVFGNYLGDGVVFDGWTLKEIRGMGRFRYRWLVVSDDEYRMYYEIGTFQGSYQCGRWQVARNEGSLSLRQQCFDAKGRDYLNVIALAPDHSVQGIRWQLVGEDAPLVITRIN